MAKRKTAKTPPAWMKVGARVDRRAIGERKWPAEGRNKTITSVCEIMMIGHWCVVLDGNPLDMVFDTQIRPAAASVPMLAET